MAGTATNTKHTKCVFQVVVELFACRKVVVRHEPETAFKRVIDGVGVETK